MPSSHGVLEEIDFAFRDVPRPAMSEICRNAQDLDGREALALFAGKAASELEDLVDSGITSAEDLYQLTPAAIHYFLPCYLRYVVRPRPYWEFSIVTGLVDFLDTAWGRKCGITYPDFTPAQKHSIRNGISFMHDNINRYGLGEFAEAYSRKTASLLREWSAR